MGDTAQASFNWWCLGAYDAQMFFAADLTFDEPVKALSGFFMA